MVQEGRGHAAIDVWAIGEAPLWSVSLFCGAGGDRAPSRSGLLHAGGCSSARAGGIDNLPRAAAQRRHPKRRLLAYRATTAQWHAERAARRRPKQAKLARNAALRTYVEERLAGVVVAPSGAPVPGPVVSWKCRRHGPRKDRRWANAWSPEQIAGRLPVDFPDDATMRISHEAIYQALFVQGRGALRHELTACLRTGRVLRMPRARTRGRGKTFISPEIMISQRPAEAADRAVPGHSGSETFILGLGSSAIGTLGGAHDALHSAAIPAAHGGPWPRGSREERARTRRSWRFEAVRDAISRTIVTRCL